MVEGAELNQVVETRLTAVGPVLDVVSRDELPGGAAGEAAAAVARRQSARRRRWRAGSPPSAPGRRRAAPSRAASRGYPEPIRVCPSPRRALAPAPAPDAVFRPGTRARSSPPGGARTWPRRRRPEPRARWHRSPAPGAHLGVAHPACAQRLAQPRQRLQAARDPHLVASRPQCDAAQQDQPGSSTSERRRRCPSGTMPGAGRTRR